MAGWDICSKCYEGDVHLYEGGKDPEAGTCDQPHSVADS